MALKAIRFLSGIDLQAERARAGLTQKALARRAGCSVQSVKYWEGQKRREDFGGLYGGVIDKLADALGLDPLGKAYACGENQRPSREMAKWLGLEWLYQKPGPRVVRHCGARLPNGSSCRKSPIPGKQRCAQHGGRSTGPKTEAGKQAIREAQSRRWHGERVHSYSAL